MTAPVLLMPKHPNIETVGRRVTVVRTFSVIDTVRGQTFHVPKGFAHDGASIPRVLGPIIQHDECGEVAPCVHDLLYRTGGLSGRYTRAEADALFRDLMRVSGVSAWKREAAYRAVRWFGGASWRAA